MHPYSAYKQSQSLPTTRIDLILTLYRRALELLEQARAAVADGRAAEALPFLNKAQMIVMGLAAGMPARLDDAGRNFLRLYEFISHRLAQGGPEDISEATKVLRTLLQGFERVREHAAELEQQGAIPALGTDRLVSVTA